MGIYSVTPTAFQSPDATLGGSAVSTPSNTGHAITDSITTPVDPVVTRSCRWHTFQSFPNVGASKKLKITHTSSGSLSGATAANTFTLSYSLNGGGSWTDAVARGNFTASQGPTTFSVDLPANQDLSQVQVRDLIEANATDPDVAGATATISDIKIEVVTVEASIIMM